jgi:hypothetical protein
MSSTIEPTAVETASGDVSTAKTSTAEVPSTTASSFSAAASEGLTPCYKQKETN